MKALVLALSLFIFLLLIISNLNAQCANLYFLRSKGGIQSDLRASIIHNDKLLITLDRGSRYKVNLCNTGEHTFSASISTTNLGYLGKKKLTIEEEKNYFIKVAVVFGIDEPVLTIMDEPKGKKLLSSNGKFTSELQEITLGEAGTEDIYAIDETIHPSLIQNEQSPTNKEFIPVSMENFWKEVNVDVKGSPKNTRESYYDRLIIGGNGLMILGNNYYGVHSYSIDNGLNWTWNKVGKNFRPVYFPDFRAP